MGRPSDIPRGVPAAVAMIHSFSAADPTDPQTIAGRWLAQGAFAYFGAVNEPFLLAFRPPGLVAELVSAEVPLVAALRQGELEPFGFPWRLVYLGDPLYHLKSPASCRPGLLDQDTAGPETPPGQSRGLKRNSELDDVHWIPDHGATGRGPVEQGPSPRPTTTIALVCRCREARGRLARRAARPRG